MPNKDEDILEQYGQKNDENDTSGLNADQDGSTEEVPKGFWWIIIVLFVVGSLFFGGLYFSLVKGSKSEHSTEAMVNSLTYV